MGKIFFKLSAAFSVIFLMSGCLANDQTDARFACKTDNDCYISCNFGAVNKDWYNANVEESKGECIDGCEEVNIAKCIDSECMAINNSTGKTNEYCTKKDVK